MSKLLVIDDDVAVLRYLQVFLLQEGRHEVHCLSDSTRALETIAELAPDLLLLDIDMPRVSGIDILEALADRPIRPEAVVLSGVEDVKLAVRALKLGAHDYLTKPIETDLLLHTIDRALELRTLKTELEDLRRRLAASPEGPFASIATRSPQMLEVFKYVEVIAPSDNAVLVWGESGTGKELLAHALHALSRRRHRPFVPVNAGVFASELFASEFFGHARGAFTGAVSDRTGILEKANGGTLFLDEVGELTLPIQVKLLRVLQDGEFTPVGSTEPRQVDVRILTATNKDLREEIERGNFRSDLFYRLDVCSLYVPPLREREGDIPFLAQVFVDKYARTHDKRVRGCSDDVLRLLERHPFPGNVRELENLINSAVLLETTTQLTRSSLPAHFLEAVSKVRPVAAAPGRDDSGLAERSLADVERDHITRVVRHTAGNRSAAARILGISRVTLLSKLKQYGIRH